VSEREAQLAGLYGQARVEDQRAYYEARSQAFEHAHRQLLLISTVVFGLAAATGLIAGLDVPGKVVFAIVAAVLPSISTLLSAYEGLYAFQRVAKLYRDAARNLRRIDAPEPPAVADYVAQVEAVFASERGQWGQLAVEAASERQKS
jgi:cation transport regulator ChaC